MGKRTETIMVRAGEIDIRPEKALTRLSLLLAFGALISLAVTDLMPLPGAIFFGLLMALARVRPWFSEKKLTAFCNVLALLFLFYVVLQSRREGLLVAFIDVLPYFLLSAQVYYLLRPDLDERYWYLGLAVILSVFEAAFVQEYSVFLIVLLGVFYVLMKGADRAESVRVHRALLKGENVRSAKLSQKRKPAETSAPGPGQKGLIVPGVEPGRRWRVAAFAVMLVPIGLIFMLLPRTGRFASLQALTPRQELRDGQQRIGFTNEISHGGFGSMADDPTIVMTVKPEGVGLELNELRWRGQGLNYFDGRTWKSALTVEHWVRQHYDGHGPLLTEHKRNRVLDTPAEGLYILDGRYKKDRENRAELIGIKFRMDIKGIKTIFTPPRPGMLSATFGQIAILQKDFNDSLALRHRRPWEDATFYTAWSQRRDPDFEKKLAALAGRARVSSGFRATYLDLPGDMDPRIRALTDQLTAGKTPYEAVQAIQEHLEADCSYSLDPANTPGGDDPLADFLFGKKTGHCEYFASSMAVMLRTAGIPSRVIAGFQRGEWNGMGEFYTVRQRDAHAWVEAFFDGIGWVAFDPSPRTQENIAFETGRSWWDRKMTPFMRYLDDKYYEYVLNYDRGTQNELLDRLVRSLGWLQKPLAAVVAWITAHSLLVGLIFGTIGLAFVGWLIHGLRRREAREVLITRGAVIRFSQVEWGDNGRAIAHAYLRIRRLLDETMAEKGRFDTAREAIQSPAVKKDFPRLGELEELTLLYERARFATESLKRNDLHRAHSLAREVKKELES